MNCWRKHGKKIKMVMGIEPRATGVGRMPSSFTGCQGMYFTGQYAATMESLPSPLSLYTPTCNTYS
jgi:hypothetical protein